MKYLTTLFITFGLMVPMAIAQLPPGPGDDITVSTGAHITQIDNNNEAEITQVGSHSGEIYQESLNGDGNYASLKQEG